MGSIRKLAGQTAIYGFSSIIGRLAVWALTPVYTARMATDEFGVFSDLYAFVTYFLVILTFGMETTFFRFASDKNHGRKPYNHAFIFITLLALGFLFFFGLGHRGFASILGYEDRAGLVLMVVGIIFLDVMVALPMAKLRYDDRPMVFAAIALFSIMVNLGLNIWFILIMKKNAADYIFISNLIASGLKFFLLIFFSFPISKIVTRRLGKLGKKLDTIQVLPNELKLDKKLIRAMAGFGLFIMLAGLFGMINQYSDVNFLTRVWGDTPKDWHGDMLNGQDMAGIYGASKKLAILILLVTQAFRYAAEPFFFKQAKGSDSKVIFARVFHYFMLAALAVFLLVSSFSLELASINVFGFTLLDSQYWVGLEVVPMLLFAFVLWGAYINISIWFKLTKQVRFGILFSGIGTAIVILTNLIAIQMWGYMGSALAMLLCYSVMTVMVYRTGQNYYPIPYKVLRTLFYAILVLGAFFINNELGYGKIFTGPFWEKLLVCIVVGGLIVLFEKFYPLSWKQQAKAGGSNEPVPQGGSPKPPRQPSETANVPPQLLKIREKQKKKRQNQESNRKQSTRPPTEPEYRPQTGNEEAPDYRRPLGKENVMRRPPEEDGP